jgi:hypothetical protein
MGALWATTQRPEPHQRWELRFGRIEYLPTIAGEPQRFTYATTLAPGLTIEGRGESVAERERFDGSLWSGLKFWADDPRSILDSGGGYWRYVPTESGVRFLTRYDYRPRWGRPGAQIDRLMFRPVFGWATAWSFDRLRLWLEDGIEPERSRNRVIVHGLASIALTGRGLRAAVALARAEPAARRRTIGWSTMGADRDRGGDPLRATVGTAGTTNST